MALEILSQYVLAMDDQSELELCIVAMFAASLWPLVLYLQNADRKSVV